MVAETSNPKRRENLPMPPSPPPPQDRISGSPLASQTRDYSAAWLEHQRQRHAFPGLSAAIAQGGRCVFRESFGFADLETGEALSHRHVFRAASHSKIATAAAILKLAEEGRIDLDAPLGGRLTFLNEAGPAAQNITARKILSHAAGIIRDGPSADFWQGHTPFPDREALAGFFGNPEDALYAGPNFKYSNIGYGLLGLLIEAATGSPCAAYLRTAILDPLGLEAIAPDSPDLTPGTPRAAGYGVAYPAGRRPPLACFAPTLALAPSAGFCATPESLALLFARLLHPDRTILSPESHEALTTAHASIPGIVEGRHYGYGVIIDRHCGHTLYSHIGLWPGHMTKTYHNPANDCTVSVAVNAVDGNPEFLLRGLMAILDFFAQQPPPSPDLVRFAGRFTSAYAIKDAVAIGDHIHIVSPDLQNPFCNPAILRREGESRFRIVSDHGFGAQGETALFGDGTLNIAGVTYRREEPPVQGF